MPLQIDYSTASKRPRRWQITLAAAAYICCVILSILIATVSVFVSMSRLSWRAADNDAVLNLVFFCVPATAIQWLFLLPACMVLRAWIRKHARGWLLDNGVYVILACSIISILAIVAGVVRFLN